MHVSSCASDQRGCRRRQRRVAEGRRLSQAQRGPGSRRQLAQCLGACWCGHAHGRCCQGRGAGKGVLQQHSRSSGCSSGSGRAVAGARSRGSRRRRDIWAVSGPQAGSGSGSSSRSGLAGCHGLQHGCHSGCRHSCLQGLLLALLLLLLGCQLYGGCSAGAHLPGVCLAGSNYGRRGGRRADCWRTPTLLHLTSDGGHVLGKPLRVSTHTSRLQRCSSRWVWLLL
mmetsp:Transcript_24179/g.61502  ORF Transcript_24179/g.61502 Transcript_24179/m.61502 type:complete len:225 (+) Transcript_24179:4443-5117(+)